ncbi:MAG: SLATT domain-containing protein [bacterium]
MAKKSNITTSQLLPWDTYKDKPAEKALQSIYERANKTSVTICTWYWLSIKKKRVTSLTTRFLTLSLLIIGTVLPLLAGLRESVAGRLFLTQFGVAALACAGLFQVADRVFGWSSGWLRYITTVTAMESLTRRFELDWADCMLNLTGNPNGAKVKQFFDLAKRFEEEILKLQSEETGKWVADFSSGAVLLDGLVKSQRESGAKSAEAARAV